MKNAPLRAIPGGVSGPAAAAGHPAKSERKAVMPGNLKVDSRLAEVSQTQGSSYQQGEKVGSVKGGANGAVSIGGQTETSERGFNVKDSQNLMATYHKTIDENTRDGSFIKDSQVADMRKRLGLEDYNEVVTDTKSIFHSVRKLTK